jgi:hypothetical protein
MTALVMVDLLPRSGGTGACRPCSAWWELLAVMQWCGPEKLDHPVKKTSRTPSVPASMPLAIA